MTAHQSAGPRREVEIAGRMLVLSSEDKVLFPATGFTKRDLVQYYLAVAPAILPHLRGRGVTLGRFPDGVGAPGFYQTNSPAGRPGWLPVVDVRGARGQTVRYCILEEPAALAWAANRGAVELHPLLAAADRPDRTATLVVDLDPTPPARLLEAARVALRLRDVLGRDGLDAWPKTSGGKGVHLHVALPDELPFREAQALARTLAARAAEDDPAGVSDRIPLASRGGKVLVDWRQASAGRSLIAPWSLRAGVTPGVAMPVLWEELERAVSAGDERLLRFGPADAIRRSGGAALAPGASLPAETPSP